MRPARHVVICLGATFLLSGGGLWLALGRNAYEPEHRGQPPRADTAADQEKGRSLGPSGASSRSAESSRPTEVRTAVVRALLEELDRVADATPEAKRQLRQMLLEMDKQLAQAAVPPRVTVPKSRTLKTEPKPGGQPTPRDEAGSGPQNPQSADGARTPVVRALLDLVNHLPTTNLSDEERQQREAVREGLLQADAILSQHLGQAAVDRIKAANEKPPTPKVFNPRKGPSSESPNKTKPALGNPNGGK